MLDRRQRRTPAPRCACQRGAMDYLTKPIELADLGRAVQRALKRREMLLENRELNHGSRRRSPPVRPSCSASVIGWSASRTLPLEALVNASKRRTPISGVTRRGSQTSPPTSPPREGADREEALYVLRTTPHLDHIAPGELEAISRADGWLWVVRCSVAHRAQARGERVVSIQRSSTRGPRVEALFSRLDEAATRARFRRSSE